MLGVAVAALRCSLPFGLDVLCCRFKLVFSFWGFVLILIIYAIKINFLVLNPFFLRMYSCFARIMYCIVSLLHLFWIICDVGFTIGVIYSCCDVLMLCVVVDVLRCSLPFGLDVLRCRFKLVFSFWGFVLLLIIYAIKIKVFVLNPLFWECFHVL